MSLYKRADTTAWWCRFKIRNQEVRRSTGTANRRQAENFERKLRVELEAALPVVQVGRTLADLRELDLDDRKARKVSPYVIKTAYAIHWDHFQRFFKGIHPKDITAARLNAYSIARQGGDGRRPGARGQTIAKELRTLKHGLLLAKREGWISQIPEVWPKIRSDPPREGQAGKLHPPELIAAWIKEMSEPVRDEVVFAMLTGLRSAELKRVRPEWISPLPQGSPTPAVLRMPASSTKSRYSREIGLPADALDIVRRRVASQLPSDGTLFGPTCHKSSYAFAQKKALKKLGIRDYKFNITLRDLRHTYGTLAVEHGVDLVAVMRSMGHKDLRTAERYQHSSLMRNASASAAVAKALGGTVKVAQVDNAMRSDDKKGSNSEDLHGAPDWIRTSYPRLRRPVLYPNELRARGASTRIRAASAARVAQHSNTLL